MKSKCAKCNNGQHSKSGYCLDHLPDNMRCTHRTSKGRQCRLPIIKGSNVCKVHLRNMQRGYGKGRYGWVYVYDTSFRSNGTGTYKIGRSVNPKYRLAELNQGNPYGKMLFAGFVGQQAKSLEGHLHTHYTDKWIEREMFSLLPTDIDHIRLEIKRVATMWYENE